MNSSPITAWEGAAAYFTFADRPGLLMAIALVAVASCVASIAMMVRHENACVRKVNRA